MSNQTAKELRKEYDLKYMKSDKGKAVRKKYEQSEKRREAQRQFRRKHREHYRAYATEYRKSDHGKMMISQYLQSESCKRSKKKASLKYKRKKKWCLVCGISSNICNFKRTHMRWEKQGSSVKLHVKPRSKHSRMCRIFEMALRKQKSALKPITD